MQASCPTASTGSGPRLVADVDMAEFAASGKLRQASFKGLRADKTAEELRVESLV